MQLSRKWIQSLGLVLIQTVMVVGCGKKAPELPPPPPPVEEPAPAPEVVEEPPAPQIESDPGPDWESGELAELTREAYSLGLLGDVYFDYDKSDLTESARDRLAANAAFMRERPYLVITVEGHCDERGTNGYNLALGDRRASTAANYIAQLGASSGMNTVSYGEERPAEEGHDEFAWQQNRRVELVY